MSGDWTRRLSVAHAQMSMPRPRRTECATSEPCRDGFEGEDADARNMNVYGQQADDRGSSGNDYNEANI